MITLDMLIPIAAKGALVLLLASAVALLLLNRSAAFRHMAWSGGLLALFLLPVLSLALPKLRVPVLPSIVLGPPRETPRFTRDAIAPIAIAPAEGKGNIEITAAPPARTAPQESGPVVVPTRGFTSPGLTLSLRTAAPVIWLTGTGLLLLWLVIGHIRARAIVRRSSVSLAPEWTGLIDGAREHAGVTDFVEIRESDTISVPLTIGLFHPVIVVPAEGHEWSSEHREDVLIHELAHIRRHDCLTHTIGWIACAVHWFNPLAWLALYRARVEREHACDDVVLSAGARPSAYAQELLSTAQIAQIPFAAGTASLAMARKSQLTGRLLAILDAKRHRAPASSRGASVLGLIGVSLVLPVAALAPATAREIPSMPIVASPDEDAAPPQIAAFPTRTSATPVTLRRSPQADAICPRAKDSEARSVHLTKSMTITGQGNAEDGSGNSWHVWSGVDCAVKIQVFGKVTFNADETDVETLSRGGKIEFTHSQGRDDRVYRVVEENGRLERTYTLNGREMQVDAAVEKWRAELVLAFIRQSGYDAEARTKRIMAKSGVDGVLAEINEINSDYAAGRYFGAVIAAAKMDDPTTARVVTAAGRRLESDYELAKVLKAVPASALSGPTALGAYVEATETIESDYELGRTLARALSSGNQNSEITRTLLKRASTMDSDYELAQLLLGLVATGTVKGDATITYLDAIPSIESDYEKQRVLTAIVPAMAGEPRLLAQSLRIAGTIESDHSLSEYLKQFLTVTPLAGDLITPFFAAVASIESDFNQQEVLVAALGRSSGPEVVTQVINATKRIESDHSQAEVLLAAIHRGLTVDQQALLKGVARGIESDYDRARVLDALTK